LAHYEVPASGLLRVLTSVRRNALAESRFSWPMPQERVLINKNVIKTTLKKSIDISYEQA
jgi:hypothetical protein